MTEEPAVRPKDRIHPGPRRPTIAHRPRRDRGPASPAAITASYRSTHQGTKARDQHVLILVELDTSSDQRDGADVPGGAIASSRRTVLCRVSAGPSGSAVALTRSLA